MAEFSKPQSNPGLRLFGEEWIEHGYQLPSVTLTEPGPCPVCGAENYTCIGEHQNG